jgi:hypothetical protein
MHLTGVAVSPALPHYYIMLIKSVKGKLDRSESRPPDQAHSGCIDQSIRTCSSELHAVVHQQRRHCRHITQICQGSHVVIKLINPL